MELENIILREVNQIQKHNIFLVFLLLSKSLFINYVAQPDAVALTCNLSYEGD
jgi:hypothetical protein